RFVMVSGPPHNVSFEENGIPAGAAAQLDANISDKLSFLSSGMYMNVGDEVTVSFANVPSGEYNFICTPHLAMGMRGKVIVQYAFAFCGEGGGGVARRRPRHCMWHHPRPRNHGDRLRDEHRHMTTSAPGTLETPAIARPHRTDIVWVSARARNVLRQPAGTLLRALLIALATMAVLVFLPRQSQRQAALMLPDESEWVDTLPLSRSLAVRRDALQRAEAELAATRDSAFRQR